MSTRQQRLTWFQRNEQAEILEVEGKRREALDLYEQNAREGCDVRHTYDRMAAIYRSLEMYDEEVEALEKAVRIEKKRGPSSQLVRLERQVATSKEVRDRAAAVRNERRTHRRQGSTSEQVQSGRSAPQKKSKGCLSAVVLFAVLGTAAAALL